MSNPAVPPPLPPVLGPPVKLEPGFWRAFRGVWLLTWKAQTTWSRLLILLAGLLALPVLIILTTVPIRALANRRSSLGPPAFALNNFARRLERADIPLQPNQHRQLLRIFREEYARADREAQDTRSPQIDVDILADQIKVCYERIRARAQPVLTERQFAEFRRFENRQVPQLQRRVTEARWSPTGVFYHWLIDLYFFVILPLNCVRASGGIIRDELQADTLGFLTTRPLSRAGLIATKYLSQTIWLQLVMAVQTFLLFGCGYLGGVPSLGKLLPLFLAAQVLAIPAWSALGAFLGQLTTRYMALALLYGLVVEMGIGRIPTNINTLSLMRHLKSLLGHNAVLQQIFDWPLRSVPVSIGAILFAAVLFLGLAAALFTVREYHRTAEMQK